MSGVDIEGGRLFYVDQGTGTPVVLVHGIPTDYRAWQAQVAGLSGRYRMIAYSRRHAQPEPWPTDVRDSTIENNARDLAQLIQRLGLPPVHLVGHSYGGFIAAYLALQQPSLLRSLTLVEPAIASLLLRDPRSRAQAFLLLLRHPSVALSASKYLRSAHAPALRALQDGQPELAARHNVNGVEDSPSGLDRLSEPVQAMMRANGRTVGEADLPYPAITRSTLARIKARTLVIRGSTSAPWLRAISNMTARAVPGADLRPIAGAGHYPHVQQPDRFNELLLGFLGRPA